MTLSKEPEKKEQKPRNTGFFEVDIACIRPEIREGAIPCVTVKIPLLVMQEATAQYHSHADKAKAIRTLLVFETTAAIEHLVNTMCEAYPDEMHKMTGLKHGITNPILKEEDEKNDPKGKKTTGKVLDFIVKGPDIRGA